MQRIGSRAQVMHGNAKMTGGGLRKKDLKYNKHGKIVSKKMSQRAKKEKRLQKAGYITKKGQFGVINMDGGVGNFNINRNNAFRNTYIEITIRSSHDFDKQIDTCNFFKEISNRNIVTPNRTTNTTTNTTNNIPMPEYIKIKGRIFTEEIDNRIIEGNGSAGEVKKYISKEVPVLEIAVKKKTKDIPNLNNNNAHKYREIVRRNGQRNKLEKLNKHLIPFLIYDTGNNHNINRYLFITPLGYNLSIFETKTGILLELEQKKKILKKIIYDINELSKVGYNYTKLKIEHIILIATKIELIQTRNDIFKYEITPYLSGLKEIDHQPRLGPTFVTNFISQFTKLCTVLRLKLVSSFNNSQYDNFNSFYDTIIRKIDSLQTL